MALSELAAIEAAYHALQSLDEAGRGRALRWLSDALDAPLPLAEAPAGGEPTDGAAADQPADGVTQAHRPAATRASSRQARRRSPAGDGRKSRGADGPAPRRGRRRAEATSASGGERVYRRMPAVEDVMAAYQESGTVSGVAAHFGVPVHTAQGWARRLRQKGHQIGRQG